MGKKIKIKLVIFSILLFWNLLLSQEHQKWTDYWEILLNLPEKPGEIFSTNLFSSSAIAWIKIYQKVISSQDLPSCVFHPSCSRFALTSIQEFGVVKGALLASDRLMRCNPFAMRYYPFDGEKLADPPQKYRLK